jgi:hypothetical protein
MVKGLDGVFEAVVAAGIATAGDGARAADDLAGGSDDGVL